LRQLVTAGVVVVNRLLLHAPLCDALGKAKLHQEGGHNLDDGHALLIHK